MKAKQCPVCGRRSLKVRGQYFTCFICGAKLRRSLSAAALAAPYSFACPVCRVELGKGAVVEMVTPKGLVHWVRCFNCGSEYSIESYDRVMKETIDYVARLFRSKQG